MAGAFEPTFEEVMEFSETLKDFLERYPKISKHVNNLHGMIRSVGRHAGGVIFTDNAETTMPLIIIGKILQTPWAERSNSSSSRTVSALLNLIYWV